MARRFEPFALMLYRRHSGGETAAQLAAAFQIPEERVVERIRVASVFAEREAASAGISALDTELGAAKRG